ncbi:MAG: ABC transporter ATP-binding protein [Candidatus Goldbacteria bacterium]|nr:ABC transporter ATP-binding protein [Candidatus Goldiibacteriota bacterium]
MITVKNLWKSYPAFSDKPGFKEFVINIGNFIKKRKEVFWALKDVSFEIKKGECVGIIGKNGAGKSTLLSVLLGVSEPTKGTVLVRGKRTPLLALGAGFSPDLSGRENIVINGILLGHTKKEMTAKIEQITAFAELEKFIDSPVRTYSWGMYMRLAFAIAVHTEPEVLMIDEILAVGDSFFQVKSADAIKKLIKNGVTTVFVSHSPQAITDLCTRVIWLDRGAVAGDGDPKKVLTDYMMKG